MKTKKEIQVAIADIEKQLKDLSEWGVTTPQEMAKQIRLTHKLSALKWVIA